MVPAEIKPKALEEIGNKLESICSAWKETRNCTTTNQACWKTSGEQSALEKFEAESEAASFSSSCIVLDIYKILYYNQKFVGQYAADIFAYLKKLEIHYPIKKGYLNRHGHLTPKMR